jgi:hypothetical protein
MLAHEPPPFNFPYFEYLPEKQRENVMRAYLIKQHPIGSDIHDAIQKLEQAGAKCAEGPDPELVNFPQIKAYACIYDLPFQFILKRHWTIMFYDVSKVNKITEITVRRAWSGTQIVDGVPWTVRPN